MSILISGIDMPKDNELLCINIYPGGKVCINLDLECKPIASAFPVYGVTAKDISSVCSYERAWYDAFVNALRQTHQRVMKHPELMEYVPPYQLRIAAEIIESISGLAEDA